MPDDFIQDVYDVRMGVQEDTSTYWDSSGRFPSPIRLGRQCKSRRIGQENNKFHT